MDIGETIAHCAEREVEEETGLILQQRAVMLRAWLRESGVVGCQARGMLSVVEDARVRAGDGHAAW